MILEKVKITKNKNGRIISLLNDFLMNYKLTQFCFKMEFLNIKQIFDFNEKRHPHILILLNILCQ